MTKARKTMALVIPLALVAACTDAAKAPAEAAMAAATEAMDSLKGDAARYAPDAVKSLESSYVTARDSMANKDYQGVLTFAKGIPDKAREVLAKVDAAKAALTKEWTETGEATTRTVEAAKSRLHLLSRVKRLPAGVDQATLARASADLAAIEAGRAAAADQYRSGDRSGAVAHAKDLEGRAAALLGSLGAG